MNAPKILLLSFCFVAIRLSAQTPADQDNRRPPHGIPIPPNVRAELGSGVTKLGQDIEALRSADYKKPQVLELLPDVQIYYNAVRYALDDDIFYKTNDFAIARKSLKEGEARVQSLRDGRAPWATATGLVVRGYVSKIDHSVIPYGLVVPASYKPGDTIPHRLDFWFHGRNDKLSELDFINDRETNLGEFTPTNTFVLHPYGRYCNADKFAGEMDVFEALADVERHYSIDTDRISVRGFSMGGAVTWHLGTHYAGLWAAVAPGAGFAETQLFQKLAEKNQWPPWYEQKLWHLYDATDYAGNLFNCGVVAYSGEIDGQRQAAEIMTKAMAAEGLTLTHIIGPNTAHKYEPKAKLEVARLVDDIVNKGRDPWPKEVKFTTWTLRYNQMDWVTVDGLEKHWERARVNAQIIPQDENVTIKVATTNVSALSLDIPGNLASVPGAIMIMLDNQMPAFGYKGGQTYHFKLGDKTWTRIESVDGIAPSKRHGLQGPIDDAFMDSFIMVRPTRKAQNEAVGKWVAGEMTNAITQWHLQFRGEARVKDDTAITDADIESSNLILWGDPESNQVLAKILAKLPLHWDATNVRFGDKKFPADKYVPVMIYPNPLNPKRYIVVNSGFTFGEAAHTSNALQTPKLPDYAVLDMSVPASARPAGGVVDAGFFDEQWQLSASP